MEPAISFSKKGKGPPLLFVHGVTADRNSWNALTPRLEHHFTVYAMDRRGRGESGDAHQYELMREAEDIVAVIEQINEPVNLFGHSYGGLCCMEAVLLTDKIRKLVLYEPAIHVADSAYPEEATEELKKRIDADDLESAMEYFLRNIAKMTEHELEIYRKMPLWNARIPLVPTIPREMEAEQKYQFSKQKFSKMKTQTILLIGSDSPVFAHDAAKMIHSSLPNCKIIVLEGEQHVAHHTNPVLLSSGIPHATGCPGRKFTFSSEPGTYNPLADKFFAISLTGSKNSSLFSSSFSPMEIPPRNSSTAEPQAITSASIIHEFHEVIESFFLHTFSKFRRIIGRNRFAIAFIFPQHKYGFGAVGKNKHIKVALQVQCLQIFWSHYHIRNMILVEQVTCPSAIHVVLPCFHYIPPWVFSV
jgi:pimeloyl-ACP methyl ester carboxylesterase